MDTLTSQHWRPSEDVVLSDDAIAAFEDRCVNRIGDVDLCTFLEGAAYPGSYDSCLDFYMALERKVLELKEQFSYTLLAYPTQPYGPSELQYCFGWLARRVKLPLVRIDPGARLITKQTMPFTKLKEHKILVTTDVLRSGKSLLAGLRCLHTQGTTGVGVLTIVDHRVQDCHWHLQQFGITEFFSLIEATEPSDSTDSYVR